MREFEQMEMQFFVPPGKELIWYDFWKESRMEWHKKLNLHYGGYKFHNHAKLAHYANGACDIEFEFPFGFKELEGVHSRTDYDLKQHQEFSKKPIEYVVDCCAHLCYTSSVWFIMIVLYVVQLTHVFTIRQRLSV